MVRIQDSQSWHRGSIPLSTTKCFHVLVRLFELALSLPKDYCKLFFCPFVWSSPLFALPLQENFMYEQTILLYILPCRAYSSLPAHSGAEARDIQPSHLDAPGSGRQ